ncbi:MAG: flippase [Candidatus Bathyarchaeota archaeon]|nr:flippase [Candidatus Bathyarchaeota archaeon]
MNNPTDIAKTSATGSFHLLWGLVTSTLISSIGTIFIANLLGSDQYGLYTIVLTAPSLISILRDWGINTAMTRFTAQFRAENRTNEIRSILTTGIIFETTIGTLLSIILLATANTIATTAFNRPEITPLIQLASLTVLANGLINAATATFVGIEKLTRNSIMLIFQAIIKTTLVIALVILGQGTTGAIIGYTTALLIAGTTGILLLWPIYKNLPKPQTTHLHLKAYLQTMLQYGIPLSLSNIILGFQTQFFSFLLPIYVAENATIGNYGIASTFSVLITFFATPITTMLLPAFSKLNHKKDNQTLQTVFQNSIKWAALFVIPPTTIVMALAEPAVTTLFHNSLHHSPPIPSTTLHYLPLHRIRQPKRRQPHQRPRRHNIQPKTRHHNRRNRLPHGHNPHHALRRPRPHHNNPNLLTPKPLHSHTMDKKQLQHHHRLDIIRKNPPHISNSSHPHLHHSHHITILKLAKTNHRRNNFHHNLPTHRHPNQNNHQNRHRQPTPNAQRHTPHTKNRKLHPKHNRKTHRHTQILTKQQTRRKNNLARHLHSHNHLERTRKHKKTNFNNPKNPQRPPTRNNRNRRQLNRRHHTNSKTTRRHSHNQTKTRTNQRPTRRHAARAIPHNNHHRRRPRKRPTTHPTTSQTNQQIRHRRRLTHTTPKNLRKNRLKNTRQTLRRHRHILQLPRLQKNHNPPPKMARQRNLRSRIPRHSQKTPPKNRTNNLHSSTKKTKPTNRRHHKSQPQNFLGIIKIHNLPIQKIRKP